MGIIDRVKEKVKGGASRVKKTVKDRIQEERDLHEIRKDEEHKQRIHEARTSVQDKYEARRSARKKRLKESGGGGLGNIPGFVFGSQDPAPATRRKGKRGSRVDDSAPQGGVLGGVGGDVDSLVFGSSPQAPGSRRSRGSQGSGYTGGLGFFDADPDSYINGRKRR